MVFTLHGHVPSKKNSYRRSADRTMYIPEDIQKELDDFLWQLKGVRAHHRMSEPIIGNIEVSLDFAMIVHPDTQDSDNMATTIFDLLQKGGIIENDKYIYRHHVSKCFTHERLPSVVVTIEKI